MSKINKIRLSGTDYDIQDVSATSVVELTQQQYDELPASAKTDNILYIITDSTVDYVTSAQTQSAITQAVSGKQDTLVSGTNIKTINNESILGSGNIDIQCGGGKAITAGRGITVTSGETADTVSFNLPISAGTGTNSIAEGHTTNKASGSYSHAEGKGTTASGSWGSHAEGASTTASGSYSHAEGSDTKAKGYYSHAEGYHTIASGQSEHASGQYNVSNKANSTWGDSGNTLFSVGNGTADNARHNAFEIRQNGDIYCSDGTNDVKLQDTITATAANTTALGGLKLVKLSQSEYNALSPNYDSNTLYVING